MSKKYVLAKDLPNAKKGTLVQVDEFGIYVRIKECDFKAYLDLLGYEKQPSERTQKELQRLIDEGWIEEVKPREFMLHFKKSNGEIYSIQDLTTKNGYNVISKFDGEGVDSIKVREVLE